MMHSCWERFKHVWNLRIAHVYCTFDEWRGFIAFRSFWISFIKRKFDFNKLNLVVVYEYQSFLCNRRDKFQNKYSWEL